MMLCDKQAADASTSPPCTAKDWSSGWSGVFSNAHTRSRPTQQPDQCRPPQGSHHRQPPKPLQRPILQQPRAGNDLQHTRTACETACEGCRWPFLPAAHRPLRNPALASLPWAGPQPAWCQPSAPCPMRLTELRHERLAGRRHCKMLAWRRHRCRAKLDIGEHLASCSADPLPLFRWALAVQETGRRGGRKTRRWRQREHRDLQRGCRRSELVAEQALALVRVAPNH
mmetsp:Transcript_41667/g.99863  ORF Transcript_41667/g.99863 Transcript_41667/m.99863 type:complete len:227 (+) Transcript_41667:408-1088(+)